MTISQRNGVFLHYPELVTSEVYMNAVGVDLGKTMGNIIAESYKPVVDIQPDAVLMMRIPTAARTSSC